MNPGSILLQNPRPSAEEYLAVSLESRQHYILIFSSGDAGIQTPIFPEKSAVFQAATRHQHHISQAEGGAAHVNMQRGGTALRGGHSCGWLHRQLVAPAAPRAGADGEVLGVREHDLAPVAESFGAVVLRKLHARGLVDWLSSGTRLNTLKAKLSEVKMRQAVDLLISMSCSSQSAAAALAAEPDSLVLPYPRNAACWSASSLRGRPGTAALPMGSPAARLLIHRRRVLVQHSKHAATFLRSGKFSETATAALRNLARSLLASSLMPEPRLRTPVISACSSSR